MELTDYVRILRKRWRMIVAVALIGVMAGAAFVATATKKYSASARLFVSTQNTADASLTAAVQGSDFSEARVTSYAQLVNTPPVMAEVIKSLGLKTTPEALAGEVSATAPLNTVLLNISVTDRSPLQAALLANTTATAFINIATQLEKPSDGSPSTVRISLVKQAFVPSAPTSPKKKIDLGLGLLVGLALGIALAVLRDTLDTSVKSPDQMEDFTGHSTLAVIGFDPEVAAKPLIIDASPHAPRAEALRQLRTNLQFVDVDNPPKSVLVTSAVPKEGKSSTTANLALTLARGGKKVILVEGDLRRPRVARYLGMQEDLPGITDVLVGKYSLDEALVPFRDENVLVLSSGHAPPNPSELLGSAAMRDLLRQLEDRADIVLVDAPPLLPVTDGAVLATICDGAILVIRAGKTRSEQVDRALDNLESVDARILGCVLNMASAKGPDAYAYGYGYDYSNDGVTRGTWFGRRKNGSTKTVSATAAELPADVPAGLDSGVWASFEASSTTPAPVPAPEPVAEAVATTAPAPRASADDSELVTVAATPTAEPVATVSAVVKPGLAALQRIREEREARRRERQG